MKKLPIVLMLSSWTLSACAAEAAAPVVQNEVAVKPNQKIAVASQNGKLIIQASESETLKYKVEFVPNKTGFLDFAKGPTQKDYDDCKVTYAAEQGLKVQSGKGLNAVVTVSAPGKAALDAQLSSGILTIAARTGKVEAFIGEGILEYDASGLSAGACVIASINAGTVTNKRDFNCESVGAVLHGHAGIITVK